jgi:hypothetical protein
MTRRRGVQNRTVAASAWPASTSDEPVSPVGAADRVQFVFNRAMLSLQEISDLLEIQQLLVDYSTAIDQRRFDGLDKVFTSDAYID